MGWRAQQHDQHDRHDQHDQHNQHNQHNQHDRHDQHDQFNQLMDSRPMDAQQILDDHVSLDSSHKLQLIQQQQVDQFLVAKSYV